MKIKIKKRYGNWYYNIDVAYLSQEQFDYIYKCLDFDKLKYAWLNCIFFKNTKTRKLFYEKYNKGNKLTYINLWLSEIYENSPEGYEYLKNNWGKNIFKIHVHYPDEQELKTIVNKVINIHLHKNIKWYNKIINKNYIKNVTKKHYNKLVKKMCIDNVVGAKE